MYQPVPTSEDFDGMASDEWLGAAYVQPHGSKVHVCWSDDESVDIHKISQVGVDMTISKNEHSSYRN